MVVIVSGAVVRMFTGGIGEGCVFEEGACSAGLAIDFYPDHQVVVSSRSFIYVLTLLYCASESCNFIKRSDKTNGVRQETKWSDVADSLQDPSLRNTLIRHFLHREKIPFDFEFRRLSLNNTEHVYC